MFFKWRFCAPGTCREDSANQLRERIDVTTSGVGWDTAYDQAQSEPLYGDGST